MENIALTQQTADQLTAILNENPEQAKKWLVLDPEQAVARINALGHKFTSKELQAYGQWVRGIAEGSLDECELEGVSGGTFFPLPSPGPFPFPNPGPFPLPSPFPNPWPLPRW